MELNRVLPGISQTLTTSLAHAPRTVGQADFSSFLEEAFAKVIQTEAADKMVGLEALSGTGGDLHNAVIAAEKAELTLNLALQIRSKIIESYQEVMRMQV